MIPDVPSPIDYQRMSDAKKWAAEAPKRPGRAQMLERIVAELKAHASPKSRVLELGSGPGFLAQAVLEALPETRYVMLDVSEPMHELARMRLGGQLDHVTFLERSFAEPDWSHSLARFGFVVTNQAVHELRHKRHAPALHKQVLDLLAPGGWYLVSDHFAGEGGMSNTELYMTADEQQAVLKDAGFSIVERLFTSGSLVLHAARITAA